MVCTRKLWYYSNSLRMESDDENVNLGKIIDESSYSREDKHININNVINIDFIKDDILYETKKSKRIEEASIMQVKYYLYYLKINGADNFTGEINYPALRQKITVKLEADDEQLLNDICNNIKDIVNQPLPPNHVKKGICKKCAYHDLCLI